MKSLTILASGAGSNAQRIAEYIRSTGGHIKVTLLSDRKSSGIYEIGKKLGVKAQHIPYESMLNGGLCRTLKSLNTDLVVLAGFLRMIPEDVVKEYPEQILNIHPSLLPKFGGKGMYGDFVHGAVLQSKDEESGITIHYVNEEFDKGRILLQARCPVDPSDDVASLRKKVQKLEHLYYPFVVNSILRQQ